MPALLPVTVAAAPAPVAEASGPAVEIAFSGAVVRVHTGVDPATLRTVLQCLRGTAP